MVQEEIQRESADAKLWIQTLLLLFSFFLYFHHGMARVSSLITDVPILLVFLFSWLNTLGIYRLKWPVILPFLLLAGFAAENIPLQNSNPFYAFSLAHIPYLFQIVLAFFAWHFSFQTIDQKILDRVVLWMPIGFLMIINVFFVGFNYSEIDPYDGSRHISNAVSIYDLLVSDEPGKFFKTLTYYDFYLPVTYISSFPFLLIFGKSFTSAVFGLILFWLPISYFVTGKILREHFQANSIQSNIIAFLLVGCSMSASMVKLYWQDFPIFALGLCFQYFLLRSDFFRDKKNSLWLGLIFGIGLLAKANFFLFGIVPFIFLLLKGLKEKDLEKRMSNFFLFFAISTVMASIWFSVNIYHQDYEMSTGGKEFGEKNFPDVMSLASWLWYLPRLVDSLGVFQSILLVVGGVVLVVRRKFLQTNYAYFLLEFGFYFILIHLLRVKDQRTLYPSLSLIFPFFLPIFGLSIRWLNRAIFALVLVFIVQENMYLVTDQSPLIPKKLLSSGFTISRKAALPMVDAPNQAYNSWLKLAAKTGINTSQWPLNFQNDPTIHSGKYYQQVIPEGKLVAETIDWSHRTPIFCRDHYWQDYYLFSWQRVDTSFQFSFHNDLAEIKGDFVLDVDFLGDADAPVLKNEVRNFAIQRGLIASIRIPDQAKRIKVKIRVHHSYPTGQRVRALYQWMGFSDYPIFNIPVEIYSPSGKSAQQMYNLQ